MRYYAEIELKRGENHVRAECAESRLQTLYHYRALGDEPVETSRDGTYFFYGAEGTPGACCHAGHIGGRERGCSGWIDPGDFRLEPRDQRGEVAVEELSFTRPVDAVEQLSHERAACGPHSPESTN